MNKKIACLLIFAGGMIILFFINYKLCLIKIKNVSNSNPTVDICVKLNNVELSFIVPYSNISSQYETRYFFLPKKNNHIVIQRKNGDSKYLVDTMLDIKVNSTLFITYHNEEIKSEKIVFSLFNEIFYGDE